MNTSYLKRIKSLSILPVSVCTLLAGCCSESSHYGKPIKVHTEKNESEPTQKLLDFILYDHRGYHYTITKRLTDRKQLVESVRTNRNHGDPHGEEYQRFNYVISGLSKDQLHIYVAVWNTNVENPVPEWTEQGGRGDRKPYPERIGSMVNFFPEDRSLPDDWPKTGGNDQSPHWISMPALENYALEHSGILDAISKHFMLAQGPGLGIEHFEPSWMDTKVVYAGEIIVDVKRDIYLINSNSGTYRPPAKLLEDAARTFKKEIGVAPRYVQSAHPKFLKKTEDFEHEECKLGIGPPAPKKEGEETNLVPAES